MAVIEDDEQIRFLVETVLQSGGHQVVSTGEPKEALELVRREAPDLVLCDISMPGMDGYQVLKALQADPETARFPVVFLTAHREFTERVQAFRYGVVDYLTKPFTRDVLLRRIEKVLRTLDQRSGIVEGGDKEAAGTLLEEVKRDARSGVLSVKGEAGETRVVLRAGEVVERTGPLVSGAATGAEFQELDPGHEQIVPPEPSHLPGDDTRLPTFEDLPEHLRTVLVVDDNPFFRRFLSDLLKSRGFTVHEAGDGEEGLRLALERRPWLVLTDVNMPGMDGFEFCRRVRSHSLVRHTPLVFLSGWDEYKDRYKGMEAGADEYLSKETSVRELLIRVQLILKRYSDLGARARRGAAAMEGGLDVVGAPGLLQMCHLGRFTGTCTATSGSAVVEARFRDGEIVGAAAGDLAGVDAVYAFLSWRQGRFEFVPGDPGVGEPLGETFDQVLLEGCRRLDEAGRTPPAG